MSSTVHDPFNNKASQFKIFRMRHEAPSDQILVRIFNQVVWIRRNLLLLFYSENCLIHYFQTHPMIIWTLCFSTREKAAFYCGISYSVRVIWLICCSIWNGIKNSVAIGTKLKWCPISCSLTALWLDSLTRKRIYFISKSWVGKSAYLTNYPLNTRHSSGPDWYKALSIFKDSVHVLCKFKGHSPLR